MEINMHILRTPVRVQFGGAIFLAFTQADENPKAALLIPNQAICDEASKLLTHAQHQADDAAYTDSLYFNCGKLVYSSESGQLAKRNAQDTRERAEALERLSQPVEEKDLVVTVHRWVQILQYFGRPVSTGAESHDRAAGQHSGALDTFFKLTLKE
jgi:hypothetical protein